MSMLSDLYKVEQKNGAFGIILREPVTKQFSFDINDLVKEHNNNSNVFWNFGDPNSPTNELVSPSATKSFVEHVYTYPGTYEINTIANINGVHFHTVTSTTVDPESQLKQWKIVTDVSFWDDVKNLKWELGTWFNNYSTGSIVRYLKCVNTHWQNDYRPPNIRVTFTGVPILTLEILDTKGNRIFVEANIESGKEYPLDFAYHLDILEVRFMVAGYKDNPNVLLQNFTISKIEMG